MNYKQLKAGDVRIVGDEVRPRWNVQPGLYPNNSTQPSNPCDNWIGVQLLGHKILHSDLINAEFRRPV